MAKRRTQENPPELPLRLLVPHEEARKRLQERVEKAVGLTASIPSIRSWDDYEAREQDYRKWDDYNRELLRRLFSNNEPAEDYTNAASIGFISLGGRDMAREIRELSERITEKVHRLQSLIERLELIPLSEEVATRLDELPTRQPNTDDRHVFVVHGHDDAALATVARFLERLDFAPVILHEQPNLGLTLIEKLERYAGVGFAVILLTPDDEGRARDAKDEPLRPRARQNVVLELGYFLAQLTRKRVCALHKANIELPSDYLGVVYVPFDDGGGWKLLLARELKAAGFQVDMNKAVD